MRPLETELRDASGVVGDVPNMQADALSPSTRSSDVGSDMSQTCLPAKAIVDCIDASAWPSATFRTAIFQSMS
jgi:hypothetical protein